MPLKINSRISNFGGELLKLSHQSTIVGTKMDLNLFLPGKSFKKSSVGKVPVLFYLAGLTCNGNNCAEKGFLQPWAEQYGLAIVYPDTSPRGLGLQGEDDDWDFGTGAGFYINATKEPYNKNYKMYDYITEELPNELFELFPCLDPDRVSITGHSMGGHGALTLFLKNPGKYKSVSAFAPITNPINCPWGMKAFTGYFGIEEKEGKWKEHDATELIRNYKGPTPKILIDVGTGDNFYINKQLLPENFISAVNDSIYKGNVTVRFQENYDHSYYFISSFARDHVEHAAKFLGLLDTSSL